MAVLALDKHLEISFDNLNPRLPFTFFTLPFQKLFVMYLKFKFQSSKSHALFTANALSQRLWVYARNGRGMDAQLSVMVGLTLGIDP